MENAAGVRRGLLKTVHEIRLLGLVIDVHWNGLESKLSSLWSSR